MKKSVLTLLVFLTVYIASEAQDSTFQQFVGKYRFPDGSVVSEVEVAIENGTLMMNSSAGTSNLQLIKGDSFSIVNFSGTALFKRNESNKVNGVHIEAMGYILDGVKDSTMKSTLSIKFRNKQDNIGTWQGRDFRPNQGGEFLSFSGRGSARKEEGLIF